MRVEYTTATGERRMARAGKSNPEFTRMNAFPEGSRGPVALRWDAFELTWREVRVYELRAAFSLRMYPELKLHAEQSTWAELDRTAEAEGVTLVERGQSWMTAIDGAFPGIEVLEVWGLT